MCLSVSRLVLLCGLSLLLLGRLRKGEAGIVYAQRCLGCHGPSGRREGAVAPFLPGPVPGFRETVKGKGVIQIRRLIRNGTRVVPAFEPALEKYEIQDLVRMVGILSMESRTLDWWEEFEPLTWAHCAVPWQYVFDTEPRGDAKP